MSSTEKTTVSFGSDNHSGIHPRILSALNKVNHGHAHAYGMDDWTVEADKIFRDNFGDCDVFYVFNGTAANILAIQSLIKKYQAVLCTDISHLNVDECGAAEAMIGCKLLPVVNQNGKVTIAELEKWMIRGGDQHFSQPKLVSITQPTEVGTVYTLDEVAALRRWCDQHKMHLHIDGARLVYAAHYLNCGLKDIVKEADVVSFGGTKNGLFACEAVILRHPDARKDFKYIRKQNAQLSSKMRFISAQFIEFLSGSSPLWKEVTKHGHDLAKRLHDKIKDIPEIKIDLPVQANSVFPCIPKSWVKPLKEHTFFYVWDETITQCRWMISYDTTAEDVDRFVETIQKLRKT